MKRHLILSLSVFWGCVVGAWVPFLDYEEYSILTNTMSHLGNFEINNGWWLFTTACLFMSLMTFPQIHYIYRRLKIISMPLAKAACFFLGFGGVLLFLIGVVPDAWNVKLAEGLYLRDIHLVISLILFVAYPIGIGLVGAVFRVWDGDKELSQVIVMRHRTAPIFILFALLIVGIVASQAIRLGLGIAAYAPTILSFALWEWIWIFNVQVALSWIMLALPEQVPNLSKSTVMTKEESASLHE